MNPSKPKALLRSLLISYLLSGILLLAMSFALYKLKLKEAQINAAVYAIYIFACFAGGVLAGKAIGSRRVFWGLLSGLLYFAVLFVFSALAGQGAPSDTHRILTVMSCCAAGGIAGGMLS